MSHWYGFIIGLSSGIIATLIAGNAHLRFIMEKAIRKLFRKHLLSLELTSFTSFFYGGGMFMTHCIEIRNNMWLTPVLPHVYVLSYGDFPFGSRAYKPFIYFRSHGNYAFRFDISPAQLLDEYGSKISSYTPDNPNLAIALRRGLPIRIGVVCEVIDADKIDSETTPLNHQRILGTLHAAVANPMPQVSPGSSWTISIISEDFGHIDTLKIEIPKDLEERKPLGDSWRAMEMASRPACLLDVVDYPGLTWPLRFNINDLEILVKRVFRKQIVITRTRTNRLGPIACLAKLWQRIWIKKHRLGHPRIKIQ